MLVLQRQKTSQQCEGIYDIQFSCHDTEGLLTSHHICGYFTTISRLYRSHVNSRSFMYTFKVAMKLKACLTGFNAFQYYKWCVNGQNSHISLRRLCYVHFSISVRIYYFGGLITAVQTLQLGRREGRYLLLAEGHYGEFWIPPPPGHKHFTCDRLGATYDACTSSAPTSPSRSVWCTAVEKNAEVLRSTMTAARLAET